MAKSTNIKPVSAARVRAAFAAGEFTAPDEALPSLIGGTYSKKDGHTPSATGLVRGRLSPSAIAAFNEQVKGEAYAGEKSQVESKTVSLPLTKMNAAGARLKRPEAFPMGEVRRLAGVEGKKGRLSAAEIAKAVEAVEAQRGWDQKPTKVVKAAAAVKVPTTEA